MRIWHQSFTVLDDLPAYRDAMERHIRKVVASDTQVVLHGMRPGTYPTRYPGTDIAHSALYAMHTQQWLANAVAAQDQGFDAYAMCTLPNPMIREARSIVDIPVVGYGEASFHLACQLGHRFGILLFIDRMAPLYEEQIGLYGLSSRCVGVRPVGFTFNDVLAAWQDPSALIRRFEEAAGRLIAAGADVIVPGEMPMNVLLATHGIHHVQGAAIMDGLAVTLKQCEMLASLRRSVGLSQSRHGWMHAQPDRARVDQVLDFYGLRHDGGPAG
jgi:Asp/Glu/hydantoin racemase